VFLKSSKKTQKEEEGWLRKIRARETAY